MNMNRPIFEENDEVSSRGSSAKSDSKSKHQESPLGLETKSRNESALNEQPDDEPDQEKEEANQVIDENNKESKLFEDAVETGDHVENETRDVIEPAEPNPGQLEGSLTLEENNQSLNESESILEMTNIDEELGPADETSQQQQLALSESQEEEFINKTLTQRRDPVKKTHRQQQNKFANLIPEEDENQEIQRIKSPGPPPLEPISQILDHDQLDKSNLSHPKHDHDFMPTTPDKMDVTLDDEYQEIEVEVKPSREELIARFQAAIEERERLQNVNNQLQHKLADSFRKKKSEDTHNQLLIDKSSQEQEQRYSKYLANIENLKKEMERAKIETERKINELKYKCEVKEEVVEQERMKMIKFKKDTGVKAIYAQNGKKLTPKEIDLYLERERQKELEVISYRIENIKLTNQLKKSEEESKQKENTGETKLEMIDFEQLKIENQTYNEKIEERNEELLKLRKKINNTVQISSHVKEKLQHVMAENDKQKEFLSIYDDQVKKSRDVLNKIKQSKDSLRVDNARLKQKSGLLGNNVLLRDFEDCVDKSEGLESHIEELKRRHASLLLDSKVLSQKISQVKAGDNLA